MAAATVEEVLLAPIVKELPKLRTSIACPYCETACNTPQVRKAEWTGVMKDHIRRIHKNRQKGTS